jgi:hypothetical protein
MDNLRQTADAQVEYLPPSLLYAFLARFFLACNAVLVWVGYWFMEHQWPGSLKLCLCSMMGVASMLWAIAGRGRARPSLAKPEARRVIHPIHALGVVGLVVAEGIFFTWVIWGPPHLP